MASICLAECIVVQQALCQSRGLATVISHRGAETSNLKRQNYSLQPH